MYNRFRDINCSRYIRKDHTGGKRRKPAGVLQNSPGIRSCRKHLWKNAPVENAQNPLEDKEMQIYSHKAKLIVVCYSLLEGMGIVLNNGVLCESLFYSVIITAILVLAGKWKYKNFKGEVI